MTKLTGTVDWGTPIADFNYIESEYVGRPFEIDACASILNYKVKNFFSKDDSLFNHRLNKPTFMNPPYAKKGKRTDKKTGETIFNEYGVDDFVRYAHQQFHHWQEPIAILLFSNVSSSKYYQDCVGEKPQDKKNNSVAVFDYPKRIQFLNNLQKPVGTPSLSSIVVLYDVRFGK